MHLGLVIPFGEGSPNAWMALFPSRPLLLTFRRRLLIRRPHPRGDRRALIGRLDLKSLLELLNLSIQFKELLDRKLLTGTV